jgi:hypothetical protein
MAVTGGRCYFLFEKKTVTSFVQYHVFAQSPPGRRPSDKYEHKTSNGSQVVFAVLFGSSGYSYTVFAQSDMCLYMHVLHNVQTLVKKFGTAVNAACQGNLSAYHKVC